MYYVTIGYPEDNNLIFFETKEELDTFNQRVNYQGSDKYWNTEFEFTKLPEKIRFYVTWHKDRKQGKEWGVIFNLLPVKEDEQNRVVHNEPDYFACWIICETANEALEKAQKAFAKRIKK